MKSEDISLQVFFWKCLNDHVTRTNMLKPNFASWMGDSAATNQSAIQIVYDSDPNVPIEGKKDMFIWVESLCCHTNNYFVRALRDKHLQLCKEWRDNQTLEEAEIAYTTTRAW